MLVCPLFHLFLATFYCQQMIPFYWVLSHQLHLLPNRFSLLLSFGVTFIVTFFLLTYLCANITKWSNTLQQFVSKLPTNCLSVFDHSVGLALKGLTYLYSETFCCSQRVIITLHKKWSFPLRISSVNVTKSAVSCGSGHIYWRRP